MFWRIRERVGQYYLKQHLDRSKAGSFIPFAEVKSILFVLDQKSYSDLDQQQVKRLVLQENDQIELHFLTFDQGFKPTKTESGLVFNPQIIAGRQVDTWLKPGASLVPKADVWIDLCENPIIPLQYTRSLSGARFHCGKEQEWNQNYLDLMIGLKEGEGPEDWVKHWIHYMKLINNNNHAA